MERMYLFNTFLQMHINHHHGLFLFFHCTMICSSSSSSCIMLKQSEKLTM